MPDKPRESAWHTVQLARHQQRPTSLDYISRITTSFVELHGDRIYGDDAAVVCGLAELGGEAVVIVAQEKGRPEETHRHQGWIYPEGFRKAQRAMKLAAKFQLPVIAFIDTPGAYSGLEAEERGTGNAIASTLALMSDIPVPVIAVVIGEGGSEGALAFGVADRILMLENAIYSVTPPERAAMLIYRDASRAEEVAPALRLTAYDCLELRVVDVVVPEPEGGAHRDPDQAARQLGKSLIAELMQVQSVAAPRRLKARYRKFRRMGRRWARPRRALVRGMIRLQEYLQRRFSDVRVHLPSRARASPATPDKKKQANAG
ncbi:MAG: acetyl-CoA carboxylase carboxyl transferase subunit alpha [Armatimonadetes bacterium]|nr:acetyl-CoA carboxylase carboxyl transferase subunit alpha [Armatimonadota bacterium]